MDIVNPVGAVGPAQGLGSSASHGFSPPAHREVPPELASKFEALMARAPSPGEAVPQTVVPTAAVAKVEDHLAQHTKALDDVLQFGNGEMSLIDLQALQIRSIAQVGILSMTHSAYVQVLGAGKGSVSSLMKNQ